MSAGGPSVRRATIDDLDAVAPLFDAYRQFYRKPPDPETARAFIAQRLERDESIVLVAEGRDGRIVGFTQLYRSFSSVSAAPMLILNDLFVAPGGRRGGVGRALLRAAAAYGRETGAIRLALSTELTNAGAQALYEAEGWIRQTEYCDYELELGR